MVTLDKVPSSRSVLRIPPATLQSPSFSEYRRRYSYTKGADILRQGARARGLATSRWPKRETTLRRNSTGSAFSGYRRASTAPGTGWAGLYFAPSALAPPERFPLSHREGDVLGMRSSAAAATSAVTPPECPTMRLARHRQLT